MGRKELRPSGAAQSLHPVMGEEPAKPKRGSIIRRRRAGSVKTRPTSMSGINASGCHRTLSEKATSTDVSILVTEASPEGGNSGSARPLLHRQNSEATVVQVLVHRESEEYNNEEDDITETQSPEQNVSKTPEETGTTESGLTIDGVQTTNGAPRPNEALTTNVSSIIDGTLESESILVTGITTDIVIDIDSNMSS